LKHHDFLQRLRKNGCNRAGLAPVKNTTKEITSSVCIMLPYTIDDIWFWFLFLILVPFVLAFLIKKVTRNCESVFTYILESASLKMHWYATQSMILSFENWEIY
jgi:hypothetical protein